MIRKDKRYFVDGSYKTQVRVTEGYRDSKTNKSKQRTVKSFGYLEDQPDQKTFLEKVEQFDKNYKKDKRLVVDQVKATAWYEDNGSQLTNFGYRFIEVIYDFLDLKDLFDEIEYKGKYNLNEIFKFLIMQRTLSPDSKRASYQMINSLYMKQYDFSLYSVYRTLDVFAQHFDDIQSHINNVIIEKLGRNTSECFFDTTNFYFEKDYEDEDLYEEVIPMITDKKRIKAEKIVEVIDENGDKHQFRIIEGLLKKGVSKDKSLDPLVQYGVLTDSDGIPICSDIFSGNTSDSKTLIPILKKVKDNFNLERIIVVADKGINCNENIDMLVNNGDGYLFSQTIKGTKGARFLDRLFDETLYTIVNDQYKYQIYIEEYEGKDKNGKKVKRKRKVLLFWDGKRAARDKKKREQKLKKAEKAVGNNAYMINHGYGKYIVKNSHVSSTGELADIETVSVDYQKAQEDAKYDGYGAIITSELQYDASKMREVYSQLWRIEDSFRITKSDLIARPIYVRTENHIKAHMLICMVTLIILRLLQHKMNYSLSVERIIRALNMCSCSEPTKGIITVIKKDTFKKYKKKIDKNGNEYYSLSLSELENETIEDFKEIFKYYESKIVPSLVNKADFDRYIKSIKIKKDQ